MKITAPPGILSENCYVVISGGRPVSVRFSHQVAVAEATMKGANVRAAKILWKDEPREPPTPPPPPPETQEGGSLPTAEQFSNPGKE